MHNQDERGSSEVTVRLSSPTTEEEEHREKEEDEDEDEEDKVDKEEEDKEEDERGSSKVTVRLSSPTTGSISSSATTQALMKACTCTYEPVPASIRLTLEHPRHPLWMECPFIWTLTSRGCLVELYCQAMELNLALSVCQAYY